MAAINIPAPRRRAWMALPAALFGLLALGSLGAFISAIDQPAPTAVAGGQSAPSRFAVRDIPADYLAIYQQAGADTGIDWAILAGIGKVETDHGRSTAAGVHSGANFAGCCAGPMQISITPRPSTWDMYGHGSVYDPADAIPAAARLLKAAGAPADYHKAIFAYNHADWYVREVERWAGRYRGPVQGLPSGPANLAVAVTVLVPRAYAPLPGWAMVPGRSPEEVDARVLPDATWVLRTYHLLVTAAREAGHHTHGDGTALDMVPQVPYSWDATALRLAHDLGWTASCAASGVAPVCPLVPAIRGVFYNGYAGHGDPAHCSGSCGAHIHVSWFASVYGNSGLVPPNRWVRVFPVTQ